MYKVVLEVLQYPPVANLEMAKFAHLDDAQAYIEREFANEDPEQLNEMEYILDCGGGPRFALIEGTPEPIEDFPSRDKGKRASRRKGAACKAKRRRAISLRNDIYGDTKGKTELHRYAKGVAVTDKRKEGKFIFLGEEHRTAPRHVRKANAMDDRMAEYMEMA